MVDGNNLDSVVHAVDTEQSSGLSTATQIMLTTVDNPYSPFDEFDEWYATDQRLGYNTPTLLARVGFTSSDLSELDQERAIDQAIDDILENGISPNYRKVTRKDYK